VLACRIAIYLFSLAMVAEAHVKWFVPCNTSDNPIPRSAVLTSTFQLFAALLAIAFLYLHGFAHALVRVGARGFRRAWGGRRVALQRHE
jgi:hypothetical protein